MSIIIDLTLNSNRSSNKVIKETAEKEMSFRIKKDSLYVFLFLLMYKLILDYTYIHFVNEKYAYSGFILDISKEKYLISLFYFVTTFFILPKTMEKVSYVFLQLHFIIMVIPMLTLYAFMDESSIFMFWVIFFFDMQIIIMRIAPNIKLVRIKNSKKILKYLIVAISIFVYGSMIKANGIPSLRALSFINVYDIRAKVKYPFLMGYMVAWQAKVVNPFLMSTSLIEKNKIKLLIAILMQLLIYLITAHKSFILIPFAIIAVMFIVKKANFIVLGSVLAPIGIYISYLADKLFNILLLPSLFIRRFLFVPAQLKFYYYSFIKENEYLYFSEGMIGKLLGLKSPYGIKFVHLIGYLYFNNVNTGANTGYLADGYANMGVFGMLLVTALLIVIFIIIDSISQYAGKEITVGLSLFLIMGLNDGALLTTLLTGGLLLLMVILYLYSSGITIQKEEDYIADYMQ